MNHTVINIDIIAETIISFKKDTFFSKNSLAILSANKLSKKDTTSKKITTIGKTIIA